jgi:hypothetical protein
MRVIGNNSCRVICTVGQEAGQPPENQCEPKTAANRRDPAAYEYNFKTSESEKKGSGRVDTPLKESRNRSHAFKSA